MWDSKQTAICRRELAGIIEERTIVLALLIQLFIAAFASFLVVGLVSLYDPTALDGQQIEVAVTGEDSESVVAGLVEADSVHPTEYEDPEVASSVFQTGGADALIETSRTADGRLRLVTSVPDEELRATVIIAELREAFAILERQERSVVSERLTFEPLTVPAAESATPYVGFTYTVLLPLLMLLPVFITGSVTVDSIREELDRNTFEVLRLAPLSVVEIFDAKLAATVLLAPLQAALWLALLFLNGVGVAHPVVLLVLVGALGTVVAVSGLWIGLRLPDRRQAQLVYSMGMLAVLAGTAILPEHPANTIAKLALGTPTTSSWLIVLTTVVLAIATVWLSHQKLPRQTLD